MNAELQSESCKLQIADCRAAAVPRLGVYGSADRREFTITMPEFVATGVDDESAFPRVELDRLETFWVVNTLYVPAQFRRRGLARLLVRAAVNLAAMQDEGLRLVRPWPIYLNAFPFADKPVSLFKLVAFYRSCGFRMAGGAPYAMIHAGGVA